MVRMTRAPSKKVIEIPYPIWYAIVNCVNNAPYQAKIQCNKQSYCKVFTIYGRILKANLSEVQLDRSFDR